MGQGARRVRTTGHGTGALFLGRTNSNAKHQGWEFAAVVFESGERSDSAGSC